MSLIYGVDEDNLWEYMILTLMTPFDFEFDGSQLQEKLQSLQQVYDAIVSVDGNFNITQLLSNLTFSYDDYFPDTVSSNLEGSAWFGQMYRTVGQSNFTMLYSIFGRCLLFNTLSSNYNQLVQIAQSEIGGFKAILNVNVNESSGMPLGLLHFSKEKQ